MIHEVDDVLKEMVKSQALAGADVEVVFDAPTRDWAARRNTPTVNLYLYDIREDMGRRTRGRYNEYDGAGTVVSRRLPPRYFRLSYLVSAWTQRAEDEHRLLSSLLGCFLRYEALPPEVLGGELAATGLPVPLSVGQPPQDERAFADVWSALGGELKPSLDLAVSVPLAATRAFPAGPPVEEGLDLRTNDLGRPAATSSDGPGDGTDAAAGPGAAAPEAAPAARTGTGERGSALPRPRGPRRPGRRSS
ncbi:DUF4255 domain-containing protein [Yinghuangia seranimata]|uniref:DUF4255 domain-containing protein n=1 Tax=Yinghuangia seranimata TaxID=408067 RepID=UPI00248ACFC9|nr:DUF4255 domain-containing protein [Yinghuangia seranimata]MDI2125251.1 DUF4255 domain-containing protein [Yinghuangia seranimata]